MAIWILLGDVKLHDYEVTSKRKSFAFSSNGLQL